MDIQTAFNIIATLLGALMGWILHAVWDGQRQLARDIRELEIGLPDRYAKRSDVEKIADALFRKLDGMAETQLKILLALDQKVDRTHSHPPARNDHP